MKKIISVFLLFNLLFVKEGILCLSVYANENKYPSYSKIFMGDDVFEKINRRIFNVNLKLNKIFVKKIHIVWASIFPEFIINSLNRTYYNIEYPKRMVSSLLQRDWDGVRHETKRFIINTTLGVAGLFDFAYKVFNLESYDEDMEQALAKCKVKCGKYLVLPFLSSTTSRDILGRIFDFLLTPTTYIMAPVAAAIKLGLLINRTHFIQPIIKMVESNFADPYDIARKFFGVQKYIKLSNYDRKNVLDSIEDNYDEVELVDNKLKEEVLHVKGSIGKSDNLIVDEKPDDELRADIFLLNYNPQNPILDSMRTALFDIKEVNKSIWSEISIWNRCFNKKIKTANIEIVKNRPLYKIRYILQKDKASPLVILFPSIGEGVNNHHSAILAKIFYDEGYSVLILGNHFQWEFLKSLEEGYILGDISKDVKYINALVNNSISYLSKKYDRVFLKRIALGTSLGAYGVLFLANEQYLFGANNIDKFIAICPPFQLTYAVNKLDKIIASWKNYPDDFKEKIAITTAKVLRAYNESKNNKTFDKLPFSNYEAKLISAFVFHQKLSDLIYTTEKSKNPNIDDKDLYNLIYDMNYKNYLDKYLNAGLNFEKPDEKETLSILSNYFINSDNYRIFHSLDDYLTDKKQLKELRRYCENKLTLFNNGAHLGFLYRDEFINELKKEIALNK